MHHHWSYIEVFVAPAIRYTSHIFTKKNCKSTSNFGFEKYFLSRPGGCRLQGRDDTVGKQQTASPVTQLHAGGKPEQTPH